MADVVHDVNNVGASISSGSFRTEGMVIAPCSMKTMGGIAHSIGGELLVRAADVVLKERKKLVLVVRETPLHLGHLEAMVSLTRMGAMIFPPVPAFYHRPKNSPICREIKIRERFLASVVRSETDSSGCRGSIAMTSSG